MVELTIPKLTKKQFSSLSPEKQEKYLQLYQTQVVPCLEVFRQPAPYKITAGGRGSGKSWSIASLLMQQLSAEKHNLVCCREIQKSLDDSVYKLCVETIKRLKLGGWNVLRDVLENENGSRVIFRGLKDMLSGNSIKSLEGYDRAWI